jgi:anti-sigma28 factor (negative regulator of flagellin synthesis)
MSMRIYNDGIAALAASQAAAAESAAQPGSSPQAGLVADSGADQIDISSLSGNVAASAAALAGQQAARVSQLAALYAKGEYQVDSLQLSRALVSEAIASGSLEEDS